MVSVLVDQYRLWAARRKRAAFLLRRHLKRSAHHIPSRRCGKQNHSITGGWCFGARGPGPPGEFPEGGGKAPLGLKIREIPAPDPPTTVDRDDHDGVTVKHVDVDRQRRRRQQPRQAHPLVATRRSAACLS